MALNRYSRYKIIIDPESKKTQGLRIGDVVRREYFDTPNLIYSLMVVLDEGVDIIGDKESHYFIGALLEGTKPVNGELLDFVRVTSLLDKSRGGALYLTATDSDSPYMDVIDGLGFEHSLLNIEAPQRTTNTTSLTFPINGTLSSPEMLLISYRIRASKEISQAKLSIGYSSEIDGEDTINISTQWSYKLTSITIDYPQQYVRELVINPMLSNGEWCEVSDINVVRLSDIATFTKATKARMGKISGIIDPVFGVLEGYGAYFQNLYATRNINIAGTLTAGDENGFASTFYVGKIHKNVIVNSLECGFTNSIQIQISSPVGIGKVRQLPADSTLNIQSSAWREERIGKRYCFSIWIKSSAGTVTIYQDDHFAGSIITSEGDQWQRYKIAFTVKSSPASDMSIRFVSDLNNIIATAPQLELGETASQYQPTDSKLTHTEDYGAWFSKGGIGGTIQNPLLKLNDDGSISSADNSFVINPDGTGHFSDGRFKWTKDSIELKDITLKWVDFDDQTKENIADAAGALSVQVFSSNGNSFINNIISTTLTAKVYKGSEEITDTILSNLFNWIRVSENMDSDTIWNEQHQGVGDTITVSEEDIYRKATFNCEVLIN